MRIAIGGFQHETNTFAPSKAGYEDFATAGGWPGLTRGEKLFADLDGYNISISGFIGEMRVRGHDLVPLAWAAASPSAHVTEDAYERIAGLIVDDLKAQMRDGGLFDAVYLCLHGAMVTEHLEDGEGELLERVRAVVGADIPVVASLDLHSNTTPKMIEHATALIAYRTYPHVDMADTGRRSAIYLDELMKGSGAVYKAFRQAPFLIPINWQCTLTEPAKSVYALRDELEAGSVATISFTPGFPAADIEHCGPSVFAYATSQAEADAAADKLIGNIVGREAEWAGHVFSPAGAVAHAQALGNRRRPVVIADTQDNPGAGGNGDTTGALRALVEADARDAVLGLLIDAEAAAAAHKAGEGAEITVKLGGRSRIPGDAPYEGRFKVEKLGDGKFTCTGPFYGGARMTLGPMAALRIGGVRVVVASRKVQAADQEMFRHVGIEPKDQKIVVLKSSVHFRADFQPIAEEVLVCAAPGPMIADPAKLPFTRLRAGVKLSPLGPVFAA